MAIEQAGQALYRTLIAPVEVNLKDAKHLIIAPDGALQVLPFEALIRPASRQSAAGGGAASSSEPRWLVQDFSISEAPSISALAAIAAGQSAAPRSRQLLAFGDPIYPATLGPQPDGGSKTASVQERGMRLTALPSTRIEVNSIAALYPSAGTRVYLGKDAREEAVKAEALDQYRYLHFAAHASIDDTRPGRSGIVLSIDPASREDGILRADEVMALHLNADLVTLSACSTGLGKVLRGEGIVGLTRAFFFAGARSVAASLWNVNDEATATLMRSFYGGLNSGLTRDDALRNAKLALVGSSDRHLRDPYYWAPFVLVGLAK
jgi:CHAT domain-containing protein